MIHCQDTNCLAVSSCSTVFSVRTAEFSQKALNMSHHNNNSKIAAGTKSLPAQVQLDCSQVSSLSAAETFSRRSGS